MGYTYGSCCGDKVGHGALPAQASGGRIRVRGGDSLSGEGMQATVSPKEERREGKEGSGMGMRAWGQEPTGCREKEKHTVHEDGDCGTMSRPCKNTLLKGPTQTASIGHAAIVTGVRSVVYQDMGLGT